MKLYRVAAGVARIGAGQLVALLEEQISPRAHNLHESTGEFDDRQLVTGKVPLQFKVGEVVGLEDLPKNLTEVLEPVGEAETKAEKLARQHHADRAEKPKRAKGHPDVVTLLPAKGRAPAVTIKHADVIDRMLREANRTPADWNALTDDGRKGAFAEAVARLKTEAKARASDSP